MRSILIVDDNLVSLKQISAQLAEHYEVSLAKSGELGLQICAQEKPDLILLDVEMPEMDGFQTLARLKDDALLKTIPVIFLTGNHDPAVQVRALQSGAMDFITKPANTDILRHRIELHLEFSAYQNQLENIVKELEDNIGVSFAELIECKDRNVAGHVLRTGNCAALLAEELMAAGTFADQITPADIDMLRRAAPFHDIGKIGVSDTILLKNMRLTEEEYASVKKHTLIGASVLKMIYKRTPNQKYLEIAIQIAEGHHENFDGSGYPHGLKGDEIPLSCRIMAVANVYDACVTDRIYREGLSHEETCRIIHDGAGAQFDPRIIAVFDSIREKFLLLHMKSQFQAEIDMEFLR
ncbi:MAG: response regulator [Spirochaetales bacterium]|jgi:putative two-component system response regulator|nr:response regulator [Spirochaetales bacterium]